MKVNLSYDTANIAHPMLHLLLKGGTDPFFVEVVVCRDTAENWYRFVRGNTSPEIVSREKGPPEWAPPEPLTSGGSRNIQIRERMS